MMILMLKDVERKCMYITKINILQQQQATLESLNVIWM